MIDAVIREIGVELGYRGLTFEMATATQIGEAYLAVTKKNQTFILTFQEIKALGQRVDDLYWKAAPTDYWEKWFI